MTPIKLLILDVDGVMTGGELPYVPQGDAVRSFSVRDGAALHLWKSAGNTAAIISGKASAAVAQRAADLGVEMLEQRALDKLPVYEEFLRRLSLTDEQAAFVGDDWLDIPPMRRCAYPIAVANAAAAVKRAARYVTRREGGRGAVAEAVERLLRLNGQWKTVTGRWSA